MDQDNPPSIVARNAAISDCWVSEVSNEDRHLSRAFADLIGGCNTAHRAFTSIYSSIAFAGEGQVYAEPRMQLTRMLDTMTSADAAMATGFRWDLYLAPPGFGFSVRNEQRMLTPISSASYQTNDPYTAFGPDVVLQKPTQWRSLLLGVSLCFTSNFEKTQAGNNTDYQDANGLVSVTSSMRQAGPQDIDIKIYWPSVFGDSMGQHIRAKIFTEGANQSGILILPVQHILGRKHFIPACISEALSQVGGEAWNNLLAPRIYVQKQDQVNERRAPGVEVECELYPASFVQGLAREIIDSNMPAEQWIRSYWDELDDNPEEASSDGSRTTTADETT